MMKIIKGFDWRLLLFIALAYLAFLVAGFPAERAYSYWQSSSQAGARQGIAMGSLSGSVWSGTAGQALINGQHLEDLSWDLQPWALIMGRIALNWRGKLADGFGQGQVAAGLDGEVEMDRVEARLDLSQISIRALQALQPQGTLNLNLRDVVWTGQALTSAQGRMVWSGAGVNFLQALTFGDLSLELETTPEGVKGILSDGGGPLEAVGVLNLRPDGQYQFTGSFAARDGDPALTRALRSLGRPAADGKVKVSQSGTLAALGLGRPTPRR
jgi:general secretion pathway protein N